MRGAATATTWWAIRCNPAAPKQSAEEYE
jgi:hypothetical protein